MTGTPESEPPLDLPGPLRTLSVPIVAGALTAWVAMTGGNPVLFRLINGWPATTGDALWANLTALGNAAAAFAACAPFIGSRPRLLWAAALAGLLGLAALQPSKQVLGVSRPVRALGREAVHVIGPKLTSNSFPSGHATTAFVVAALAFAIVRRGAARAAVLAAATLIAASRVAVGAHWPLDVLAGAALGWICGCAALHLAVLWPLGLTRWGRIVVAALPLLGAVALLVPDKIEGWLSVRPVLGLGMLVWGLPAFMRQYAAARESRTN